MRHDLRGLSRLWVICATLMTALVLESCRPTAVDSELEQIFSDQRRSSVRASDYSYILNMNSRCTAFILDAQKQIGITAEHCQPAVGNRVCWGSNKLSDTTCEGVGKISRIIEKSSSSELDYSIFAFTFDGETPKNMKSVRIAKNDQLAEALSRRTALAMIGYPADKYQNRSLTRSDCRVRSAEVETSSSTTSFSQQMINAWQGNSAFSRHPAYEKMREACYFINDRNGPSRPSFVTDCSVYGGNSGGPMVVAETNVVLSMPATYLPETPVANKCYTPRYGDTTYWDIFFRPILNRDPPEPQASANWDKLDRNDEALTNFPKAIPMHLVASQSEFFKANPNYLAEDIFESEAEPTPPPVNSDIFLAIGRETSQDSYVLHIGVAAVEGDRRITQVSLCVSAPSDTGLTNECNEISTAQLGATSAGRLIFTSRQPINLATGELTYGVVATDKSGQLVSTRRIRFAP